MNLYISLLLSILYKWRGYKLQLTPIPLLPCTIIVCGFVFYRFIDISNKIILYILLTNLLLHIFINEAFTPKSDRTHTP